MAEHVYIVLAGVPDIAFDYVRSQPRYKLGAGDLSCTIISRPLKRAANGIYRYAQNYYVDVFAKLCIDLTPRVKANMGIEISIFLIYVAYDPADTQEFVRKFFPFTLNYAVPDLGFVGVSKQLLHQRRNALVQHIKNAAMLLRNKIGPIKHTLNSHRSTTAFLLPLANFR